MRVAVATSGLNSSTEAGDQRQLVLAFLAFTFLCQLIAALGVWPGIRVAMRAGPFLASIAMLFIVRGTRRAHPALPWAIITLAITWLMLLNPTNSGVVAALAGACLSTAVLAPIFWASRLRIERNALITILFVWWLFHAVSAILGILQLYWPETFAFPISDQLMQAGPAYLEGMSITRPDGVTVLRPTGLTDTPGGAAISAMYVLVAGTALALNSRRPLLRLCVYLVMLTGAACLFVCQIRSVLIVTVLCVVLTAVVLVLRKEIARAQKVMAGLALIVFVGFIWAVSAGGTSIRERFDTLAEGSPAQLYYDNRGQFLERTVLETLPEYPLGGGLGRWGMMNRYFADENEAPSLYAEVQWTGWVYDGGVPLVLANGGLLIATLLFAWRLAIASRDADSIWLIVILALSCGLIALSFGAPVFATQWGLEFWLLNGFLTLFAPRSLRTG